MTSLHLLPTELALKILERLDFKSLVLLKLTCNRLKTLIEDSVDLKYKVELAAAGLRDCPDEQLSTVDRLDMLQRYQQSWRDLAGQELFDVPPPEAEGLSDLNSEFVFSGGILAQIYPQSTGTGTMICLTRLPSKRRRVDYRRWYLSFDQLRLNNPRADVTIDVSQDLLLFVTLSSNRFPVIHVCSLSTGLSHPLGPASGVIHIQHGHLSPALGTMEICGEYGAMVISSDGTGVNVKNVCIWNWRTGAIQTELVLLQSHVSLLSRISFCFLDDSHILTQSFPLRPPSRPLLQVYNFRTQCLLEFALPDNFPSRITRASFLHNSVHQSSTTVPGQGLFITDLDDKLVILRLFLQSDERFELSTPARRLVDISCASDPAEAVIPWTKWGATGAHLIHRLAPPHFLGRPTYFSVFGMRTVHIESYNGNRTFVVTDYHPRRVKRTLTEGVGRDNGKVQGWAEGSEVEGGYGPGLPTIVKKVTIPDERLEGLLLSLDKYYLHEDGLLVQIHERVGNVWTTKQRCIPF